jgi:hypothetical protein
LADFFERSSLPRDSSALEEVGRNRYVDQLLIA